MKKVLLVVAALALVLSGVNAAEVKGGAPEVTVSVSGSAKVQFGINLNDQEGAAGFKNASSASASITILPATAATSKGEEETYATITVADVKVAGTDGDVAVSAGSVSAKIVMGALYINILGVENLINKAGEIVTVLDGADGIEIDNKGEFNGLEVGYAVEGIATFSLGITSNKDWNSDSWGTKTTADAVRTVADWDAGDEPDEGYYQFITNTVPAEFTNVGSSGWYYIDGDTALAAAYEGQILYMAGDGAGTDDKNDAGIYNLYLAVGITAVENLSANLYFGGKTNGFYESSSAGIGFDAAYTLALSETMKLIPSIAVDTKITGATATVKESVIGSEGVFGVALTMPGAGVTLNKSDDDNNVTVAAGLTTKFRFTTDNIKDASEGSTFIGFATGDLLPVVNAAVFAELLGAPGNDMDVAAGLGLVATLDQVSPYAQLFVKDTDTLSFFEASDEVKAIIGVDVKPITLLTLNLEWKSGDLTYADSKSFATDALGTVVFTAEIKL